VRLERIGLVVNPRAGVGGERNQAVAEAVLAALAPCEVVAGPGEPSAAGPDLAHDITAADRPAGCTTPATTRRIAREAVRQKADALVVIGGDGTMADAVNALFADGSSLPVLGVGAGSTNAGALVSLDHTRVSELATAQLETQPVTALELQLPTGDKVLAFNDVVVGNTVCGTLDGRYVNLAAEALMRGERLEITPEPLRSAGARVSKVTSNSAPAAFEATAADADELTIAQGDAVASIVIGFTRTGDVQGQALLGGLGLSAGAGIPAGCLVASFPLVFAELWPGRHTGFEPLRSSYAGLGAGESIRLTGLGDGAVLCADGNPLHRLRPEDVAEVRVVAGACQVVRLVGGGS